MLNQICTNHSKIQIESKYSTKKYAIYMQIYELHIRVCIIKYAILANWNVQKLKYARNMHKYTN